MGMIEKLKNNSIILADERNQREILKALSEKSLFLNLHFINPLKPQSLVKSGYLFYMTDFEHVDYDRAMAYLWIFDYLDLAKNYPSETLVQLRLLKQRLLKQKLLYEQVIPSDASVFTINEMFLAPYVPHDDVTRLNTSLDKPKNAKLYLAKNASDVYLSVFERVLAHLEEGVDINRIVILNTSAHDDFQLQKVFDDAKLPLHINKPVKMANDPRILRFKARLQDEGYLAAKAWLTEQIEHETAPRVLDALIALLNRYKDVDLEKHTDLLVHMIDAMRVKPLRYKDCINVHTLDDVEIEDDKVYLLMNYDDEHLPQQTVLPSILTQAEMALLGMPSRDDLLNYDIERHRQLLQQLPHLELFLDISNPETKRIARILDQQQLEIIPYRYLVGSKTYLNHSHQLLYAKARYDLETYYIEQPNYRLLKAEYEPKTALYKHQFSGIDDLDLKQLIKAHPSITGAKLESYQLCRFQYLAKYLLQLEPYETSIYSYLGTLSHKVLERLTNDPSLSIDEIVDADEHFPEEQAFKKRLFKQALKEDLALLWPIVLRLHETSDYKTIETERAYRFPYDKDPDFEISGIIDKTMIKEDEDGTHYVVFIDYKLSDKDFKMEQFNKRLQLQLPMYLYAYKQLSKVKFQAVGLFYQTTSIGRQKKSEQEIQKQVALSGVVLNDKQALLSFNDLSLIKGVDLKNDGDFKKSSRVLTSADFAGIEQSMADLIEEMTQLVKQGRFDINPMPSYGAKKDSVSCEYCAFAHLCYNKNKKAGE